MSKRLVFIYDGECPFCNHFAELLELKSNIPSLELKDARDNPPEIPIEYDMDVKGALLILGNERLSGAEAINFICTQLDNPSDPLLLLLRIVFRSNNRTKFIFPFLIQARRMALLIKKVPRKINLEIST